MSKKINQIVIVTERAKFEQKIKTCYHKPFDYFEKDI